MAKQTLHTIAAALGISHVTVSLALSGSPRIAETTRQRIRDYAASVGYRPNRAAQALKRRETKTIGYVLPSVAPPFSARVTDHLYRAAAEEGYLLQMVFSGYDLGSELRAIDECMALPVDGLILTSSYALDMQTGGPGLPLQRIPKQFPLAANVMHVDVGERMIQTYGFDHRLSFQELTRWALARECQTIHLLLNISSREVVPAGEQYPTSVTQRVAASHEVMRAAGLPVDRVHPTMIVHPFEQVHIRPGAHTPGDPQQLEHEEYARAAAALRPLLESDTIRQGRVAILTMNDQVAAVAIQECRQRGLTPGKDVMIAGCDDTLAAWIGFTSFRWDYQGFARGVIRGLLAQMNEEPLPSPQLTGGRLMVRG